ncbi:serine aminopeptidase domain-containing protein [Mycolicibacterium insubricum]|uniref:serine aminopeptidase domain-containing protein n=1 Tax=Mycolicibacterium insubricum TaxID=444597 RepID=UPI0027E27E1A|nr:alpha/beta hydrolase [Mycolicibacterium insubricum]
MAHGFAGTKDSGLAGFAERLQAAGLAVLAFDYRGFGTSEGRLRQQISIARQLDDYRAGRRHRGATARCRPGPGGAVGSVAVRWPRHPAGR